MQSGDYIPDFANQVASNFYQREGSHFKQDKNDVIDLTRNLCHWAYSNGYTYSRLAMIFS